jgi:hypothetical protein
MKLLSITSILFSLILVACHSDETFTEIIAGEGNINLANLEEGQKSKYLRYQSTCGSSELQFTGDTLLVEAVIMGEKVYLKESLTLGSPANVGGYRLFEVKRNGHDVLIPERDGSFLFYFYGNDTLHLQPSWKVDLIQQGCRMILNGENFIGNEIGRIPDFRIGNIRQVDKTVVSCVPIFFAIDAYLIYDENYLYMSHTVTNDLGDAFVSGWVISDR